MFNMPWQKCELNTSVCRKSWENPAQARWYRDKKVAGQIMFPIVVASPTSAHAEKDTSILLNSITLGWQQGAILDSIKQESIGSGVLEKFRRNMQMDTWRHFLFQSLYVTLRRSDAKRWYGFITTLRRNRKEKLGANGTEHSTIIQLHLYFQKKK